MSVLCEYDALPEIGHACGHNLIAECGVAAGIGIKAAMDNAGQNIGKVRVRAVVSLVARTVYLSQRSLEMNFMVVTKNIPRVG